MIAFSLTTFLLVGASDPTPPRYVLSVTPGGGEVRVVLAGRTIRFKGDAARTVDVGILLRRGANDVRLGWTSLRRPGTVTISRLDGTEAQILLRYGVDGALKPRTGVVTVCVVRDDAPRGTVKLSAAVSKGILSATLNGRLLGDFASLERRDVSALLRRGRNTLKVQWSKDFGSSRPSGSLRLTAGERELVQWNGRSVWTMNGSQSLTFDF